MEPHLLICFWASFSVHLLGKNGVKQHALNCLAEIVANFRVSKGFV
jgi:hypothetical protein